MVSLLSKLYVPDSYMGKNEVYLEKIDDAVIDTLSFL